MKTAIWLSIVLLASGCALCRTVATNLSVANAIETTVPASFFIDSVGVNIHLHYQDSAYNDFANVEKALVNLGVHHVRDGLVVTTWQPYYDRLKQLSTDGIHALLIASSSQSATDLAAFPSKIPGAMEGFEGPNELDSSGGSWLSTESTMMARLAPAATLANLPLIAPSLTQASSFAQIATISPAGDKGNLHNYFAGRNPGTVGWGDNGYGSYAYQLALAQTGWPNKPIWTTETGYIQDTSQSQGIPEAIAARYMPRLLLEQYRHGIQRTYLYELVDTNMSYIPADQQHYGLMHSDFTPKPSYLAVQSLLSMLNDTSSSVSVRGTPSIQLSNMPTDLHTMLFSKGNGEYDLLLWVEEPGYDVNMKSAITVPSVRLTASWNGSRSAQVLRLGDDGLLTSMLTQTGTSVPLSVNDNVTVVRLR